MGYRWECDFYINFWPDVIEEDALNEKCCTEVLRKLMAKADNDIEGLEGELLFLETQLLRADKTSPEEWFVACCRKLKEKIISLELSICSLKDEFVQNENNNGDQSPKRVEPPKKVREIIKEASLRSHLHVKLEQSADVAVQDLILDASNHGNGQFNVKRKFTTTDLTTVKAELVDSDSTPKTQRFSVKLERMSPDQLETMKIQEAGVDAAVNSCSTDLISTLQQMDMDMLQLVEVDCQEPTPATDKELRLEESPELQSPGATNSLQSESSLVQRSNIGLKPLIVYQKKIPSLNSQGKKSKTTPAKSRLQDQDVPESGGVDFSENNITAIPFSKSRPTKRRKKDMREGEVSSSTRSGGWSSSRNKVSRVDLNGIRESNTAFTRSHEKQVDNSISNSIFSASFSSGRKKVNRADLDGIRETDVAFTPNRANLSSLFKSQGKAKSSTLQLDAVEVKDLTCVASSSNKSLPRLLGRVKTDSTADENISKACVIHNLSSHNAIIAPLDTPELLNLKKLPLTQLWPLARSLGITGISNKRKAILIDAIEEKMGRCH